MRGVFAGMIAGVAAVVFLILTHQDPFFGWSAGFVALCLNFVITVILSLLAPRIEKVLDGSAPARTLVRKI